MKYSEKLDCDMVNLTKTWLFFKANRTAINDKIYSYNTTIIPYQNQRSNRNRQKMFIYIELYHIKIKDQTATNIFLYFCQVKLYHIKIKDQTATCQGRVYSVSKLYHIKIKDQTATRCWSD